MDSYAAGGGLRGAGMFSFLKEPLLSCAWDSVIRYHSSEVRHHKRPWLWGLIIERCFKSSLAIGLPVLVSSSSEKW